MAAMAPFRQALLVLGLCAILFVGTTYADTEVTDANFAETLSKCQQTFVKFYSPYCGWCQKLAPLWTEVSAAFDGVLCVVALDVTVHKKVAAEQMVSSVPTLKLFNGISFLADYKGPRTQLEMGEWLIDRLIPSKIEYKTPEWSRYTQTSYSLPARFLYIHSEDQRNDISSLVAKVQKNHGIFAETTIPSTEIEAFLSSYSLTSLPVFASVVNGHLTQVPDSDISGYVKNIRTGQDSTTQEGKRFGNDGFDSHSTFTFVFLLAGIIGIAVFAYKKLRFPKKPHDHMRTV